MALAVEQGGEGADQTRVLLVVEERGPGLSPQDRLHRGRARAVEEPSVRTEGARSRIEHLHRVVPTAADDLDLPIRQHPEARLHARHLHHARHEVEAQGGGIEELRGVERAVPRFGAADDQHAAALDQRGGMIRPGNGEQRREQGRARGGGIEDLCAPRVVAAGDQQCAVRQHGRGVAGARLPQRHGHGLERPRRRVEQLRGVETGRVLSPARDQHPTVAEQRRGVVGARHHRAAHDREGARGGIEDLRLADWPAGVLPADDQDATVAEHGGGMSQARYLKLGSSRDLRPRRAGKRGDGEGGAGGEKENRHACHPAAL